MRFWMILGVVALCSLALPGVVRGQQDSSSPPDSVTALDRWIATPRAIALSPAQRVKFDSIRAQYVAEKSGIQHQAKRNDVAMVVGMRRIATKYQFLLKAILTTEQRAILDGNVRAFGMGKM